MTWPYRPPGCDCQKIAAIVWSAVRRVLVSEPSDLTSLKSSAYAALVSAFGPSDRSISALGMRNGLTFATHGVGSTPNAGGDLRHSPGAVATVVRSRCEQRLRRRLTDGDPARLRRPVGYGRQCRVVARLENCRL